ncbi:MAG TPA: NrfD/PsrC family molybdoenzyme membrane anchor subunit [Anaerolineae bacterium]
MSPETQAPGWEWYFVAMYFFVGGTSAGAYFVGSLVELFGAEHHREISKVAYYIAFPLILITPVLLIADLGRPERFWHLFFYVNGGIPYINLQSPLSVGSWALLVFGAFAFLSFLDNLVQDGYFKFAPLANVYNRRPRKLYALLGSLAGFFIAGYTGVLLNTTARPLWVATDPLLSLLFVVSAGSAGAAIIALVMAARRRISVQAFENVEAFDRISLVIELLLIILMVVIAGQFAAPLFIGPYALLFWGGTVVLGILVPLALGWYTSRRSMSGAGLAMLSAFLVLLGGALLRIALVTAGQA